MSNMDERARAFVRQSFNRCAWGLLGTVVAGSVQAASYGLTPYEPPAASNPWSYTVEPLQPVQVASYYQNATYRYTLTNAQTGEVRTYDHTHYAISSTNATVNARGDLLVSVGRNGELTTNDLFRDGRMTSLAPGVSGFRLQDDGAVHGEYYSNGNYGGVMYSKTGQFLTVASASAPGSSDVAGVNASGVVIGNTRFMGLSSWNTAVKGTGNGTAQELAELPSPQGAATWANAINDAGWILGKQTNYTGPYAPGPGGMPWGPYPMGDSVAVRWDPSGQVQDLNTLLGADWASRVHLTSAWGFDDASQSMLVSGYELANPGVSLNFRLSAVPEPQTWALMGLGLVGVGAVARRRRAVVAVRA